MCLILMKGIKTMSSVEIVEVINAMRAPGKAVLRHDTFLLKVDGHPGITRQNFLGSYFDQLGREKPCYYLPKREAELMVMSESLEVQASPRPARGSSAFCLAQPLAAPSGVPPRGLGSLPGALVNGGRGGTLVQDGASSSSNVPSFAQPTRCSSA